MKNSLGICSHDLHFNLFVAFFNLLSKYCFSLFKSISFFMILFYFLGKHYCDFIFFFKLKYKISKEDNAVNISAIGNDHQTAYIALSK